MNIEWGSPEALKFVNNVGLITSRGPSGDNIMSAEWTHQIAYEPGLVAVSLRETRTTFLNIKKTKVFGVNLAAVDQNIISSVAGGSHGSLVDKISALKELGFKFYPGKKIKCLMVKDASLNIECKLVKIIKVGGHTMLIGEAVDVKLGKKDSLVYHNRKYWKLGANIPRPNEKMMNKIAEIIVKNKR